MFPENEEEEMKEGRSRDRQDALLAARKILALAIVCAALVLCTALLASCSSDDGVEQGRDGGSEYTFKLRECPWSALEAEEDE